jgi:uncharacterized protein YkwD
MRSGAIALGLLAALVLSSPLATETAAGAPLLAQVGATVTRAPTETGDTSAAEPASMTPAPSPATVTPVPATPAAAAGALSNVAAAVTSTATPTPPSSPAGATPTAAAAGATPTAASAGASAAAPPAAPPSGQADAASDPFRDREDRMALMVGRARVSSGLLPLARSAQLDRAAVAHAQDMAAHGYMDHNAPDGSSPAARAAAQGYTTPPGSAWLVVEAISAISDQPDGALGWWLSDAVHRRVLMHGFWRELGVGYVQGGPYGRFWVAEFGCRPNVLPPVLLDGMLDIPTESCGSSADAFGKVQSVRVGETAATAQGQDWSAYASQQPWPAGHPAVVDLRDASGQQLEARAADPTGATTQSP